MPERISPIVETIVNCWSAFRIRCRPIRERIQAWINWAPRWVLVARHSSDTPIAAEALSFPSELALGVEESQPVGAARERGRKFELQRIILPMTYWTYIIGTRRFCEDEIAANGTRMHHDGAGSLAL